MANKAEIQQKIDDMYNKLDETLTGLDRGPVKDALRIVVPMLRDQLDLIEDVLALAAGDRSSDG